MLNNRHIVAITLKLHISGFVKKQDHRLEQRSCSSRSSLRSHNPQAECSMLPGLDFAQTVQHQSLNREIVTDCLYVSRFPQELENLQ